VVARLAVLVDPAGVVAGAEVVVAGGAVGQQVPDDDQDGAGDGDEGFELSSMPAPLPGSCDRSCSALLSPYRTHPKPSATAGHALSGHNRPIGGADSLSWRIREQ
jgi:hypothetical protein